MQADRLMASVSLVVVFFIVNIGQSEDDRPVSPIGEHDISSAESGNHDEVLDSTDELDARTLGGVLMLYLVGGTLLALVLTSGWKQLFASGLVGLAVFEFVMTSLNQPPDWSRPATRNDWMVLIGFALGSAGVGILLVGYSRLVYQSLPPPGPERDRESPSAIWSSMPYAYVVKARKAISPQCWEPQPERSLLSATGSDRRSLTYRALTGACVGALIADLSVVLEVLEKLRSPFGLLQVIFFTVVSAGFLAPLSELISPRHAVDQHEDKAVNDVRFSKRLYWYALISVWSFGMVLFAIAVQLSIDRDFPTALLIGLVNGSIAGASTYYWSASCQTKARSVAIRSMKSASTFGAIILFPTAYLFVWVIYDPLSFSMDQVADHPGSGVLVFLGVTLMPFLLAVFHAIAFGFFSFGLYAVAGGWAIERGTKVPVWLRILIAVVAIDLVKVTVLFVALHFLLGLKDLTLTDFAAGVLALVGWGVALAINPRAKKVLVHRPDEQVQSS